MMIAGGDFRVRYQPSAADNALFHGRRDRRTAHLFRVCQKFVISPARGGNHDRCLAL